MLIYGWVYKTNILRKLSLILFGIFFYYKSGGYFFILLLITTVTDFYLGKAIYNAKSKSISKRFMLLSISINLLLLIYFKYYGFIIGLVNDSFSTQFTIHNYLADIGNLFSSAKFDTDSIFLPIGISFFTFQAISYAIDVYRKKIEPLNSILDYCFFVTYFPQLLAGPIVRASEFVPQIKLPYHLTPENFKKAVWLILGGLTKKIFISDYISGNFVDRVFDNPLLYSGFEGLMAVYGYTIQIYCDFSGYTDIAIGLAILMGFHLPWNFDSPYQAQNITSFWRKWHISLSAWLRDYLYISLGGNRKGKIRTYINLLLTMLLGGLWHGASLKFIWWGGLHGLALAIHKIYAHYFPSNPDKNNFTSKAFAWLLTFHFVAGCWILFRADSMQVVSNLFYQIFYHFNIEAIPDVIQAYGKIFAVMGIGYLAHWLPRAWKDIVRDLFTSFPIPIQAIGIAILLIALYQISSSAIQPFIYFQF